MSKNKQDSLFWGIILLLIGSLFLMENLLEDFDVLEFLFHYWPVILIAIGLKNIWQHFDNKKQDDQPKQTN